MPPARAAATAAPAAPAGSQQRSATHQSLSVRRDASANNAHSAQGDACLPVFSRAGASSSWLPACLYAWKRPSILVPVLTCTGPYSTSIVTAILLVHPQAPQLHLDSRASVFVHIWRNIETCRTDVYILVSLTRAFIHYVWRERCTRTYLIPPTYGRVGREPSRHLRRCPGPCTNVHVRVTRHRSVTHSQGSRHLNVKVGGIAIRHGALCIYLAASNLLPKAAGRSLCIVSPIPWSAVAFRRVVT